MKRSIVIICVLLFGCTMLRADVVSQEKARTIAENFLHVEGTRASGLSMHWDGSDAATRAGEAPLFYIFTKPGGGWVMVAGDDAITPILGYSYHGTFGVIDEMPENAKAYFDGLKADIRQRRTEGRKADKAGWAAAMVKTRADDTIPAGRLLETPLFDQGSPWNLLCPTINGKHAYAGCCPIAQCIIMKYHNWPPKGTGSVGGYSSTNPPYTAPKISLDDHEYEWDAILNSYTKGKYNDKQATAVATLVRDVGFAGGANYSLDGTGGLFSNFVQRMAKYFYYTSGMETPHSYYTDEEWFQLIKADMDNGLPINYASNNHSYVADGYDARGYVHFNYGWGGSSNGYYNIEGKRDYSMCVHITPKKDATATYPPSFLVRLVSNGIVNKDSVEIVKGVAFNLAVDKISNLGFDKQQFQFIFAHMDKDGNVKEFASKAKTTELGYTQSELFPKVSCKLSEDICVGDYIQVLYHIGTKSTTPWEKVAYSIYSTTVCGKLLLTGDPIEDATSMQYDKVTKKFTFVTDPKADFALLDANGNEMPAECFLRNEDTVEIYGEKLSAGEYTVRFSARNYVDNKEIKIRVK